jgi:polyhydroxyalkanoate synthesis regulator phasin
MTTRQEAMRLIKGLEEYKAEGPDLIASVMRKMLKDLDAYEQEIESLRDRVKQLELEVLGLTQ